MVTLLAGISLVQAGEIQVTKMTEIIEKYIKNTCYNHIDTYHYILYYICISMLCYFI